MSTSNLIKKLVFLGDGNSGKTSFLITLTTGAFPNEYIPTVFDNYSVAFGNYSVGLWDTGGGGEDYHRLRPLSYPNTDLFIVCFSIPNPISLERVDVYWLEDIKKVYPDGHPWILLGMKCDMRNDLRLQEEMSRHGRGPVTYEEAYQKAILHGAVTYIETSSLENIGLSEFKEFIFNYFDRDSSPSLKFKKKSNNLLKKLKQKEKELRLLILGLDNAGKTTILKKFNGEDITTISPTLGFNIQTLQFREYKLNIWDIGGQKALRSYWRNYYEENDAVIWVIDSSDLRRIEDCKLELKKLLEEEKLAGSTFLIFANKQDLDGALSVEEISKSLDLESLSTHHWDIKACSAVTGQGLEDGIDWVVNDIISRCFILDD